MMSEELKPYSVYKDSGIDWIKEIPEGWSIEPLKAHLKNRNEKNTPIKTDFILSLTNDRGVIPYNEKGDIGNRSKDSIDQYMIAHAGDIVLNSMNVVIGSVDISKYYGAVSPVYYSLYSIKDDEDIRFFNYLFKSPRLLEALKGLGNGILEIRMRIPMSNLGRVFLPIPSAYEQRKIADYLDQKTNEIDFLIKKTEKSIELLEEYRKSVISEAVTKGLDPDAPMKDSGIEWIGEIPEHWNLSKVKYEFVNHDNKRKPIEASQRKQESDSRYPYYGASGIIDYIDEYIFENKNILIGEDGANLALRNLPLVYIADGKYWVNNHAHILEPKESIIFDYGAFQLELVDLTHFLTGSTQPKLTQENLGLLPIILPPLFEQQQIVTYLITKIVEIDSLIDQSSKQVELLKRYRKSLISEAVTGKFKVPGVE